MNIESLMDKKCEGARNKSLFEFVCGLIITRILTKPNDVLAFGAKNLVLSVGDKVTLSPVYIVECADVEIVLAEYDSGCNCFAKVTREGSICITMLYTFTNPIGTTDTLAATYNEIYNLFKTLLNYDKLEQLKSRCNPTYFTAGHVITEADIKMFIQELHIDDESDTDHSNNADNISAKIIDFRAFMP